MPALTLQLLALPRKDAHQRMVTDALVPNVDVSNLQIGDPFVRGDGRVGFLVSPTEIAQQNPEWKYYGDVDYSARRMPLEEFFAGLDLKIKLPGTADGGLNTNSNEVVAKLSEIFNIQFDPTDYFSDAIVSPGSAQYLLRATTASTRWTGQVNVTIYPDL